jgi:hypothetical protein
VVLQSDANPAEDDGATIAPASDRLTFSANDDDYPEIATPMPFRRRLLIGLVLAGGIAVWSVGLIWLGMQLGG